MSGRGACDALRSSDRRCCAPYFYPLPIRDLPITESNQYSGFLSVDRAMANASFRPVRCARSASARVECAVRGGGVERGKSGGTSPKRISSPTLRLTFALNFEQGTPHLLLASKWMALHWACFEILLLLYIYNGLPRHGLKITSTASPSLPLCHRACSRSWQLPSQSPLA